MVLEMFLWATPRGMKTFKRTREEQESTKVLAGNQGLYNGFLAAGLFWSFFVPADFTFMVRMFFLTCVVVAGVYGGVIGGEAHPLRPGPAGWRQRCWAVLAAHMG